MKKNFILFVFSLLSLSISAEEVEIEGINYKLIEKTKEAEVSMKTPNYEGDVVIPNSILFNGVEYGVTAIGKGAFGYSNISSIIIPNSVIKIDKEAFICCKLSSISIPNSITEIGVSAFESCVNLIKVEIPNSVVSIGASAFYKCDKLINIVIPNGVTSIGERTFQYCSNLESIILPGNLKEIGTYAFRDCIKLSSITFPDNLEIIGGISFYNCKALENITLPNSVTNIDVSAFEQCTSLKSVRIGSGIKEIRGDAFAECENISEVTCLAEKVPKTPNGNVFDKSLINYATLYVPSGSVNEYMEKEPWNQFGKIIGINEGGKEQKKCATPTINYSNGKLVFNCETDNVAYKSKITNTDIGNFTTDEVQLCATYTISVYAAKAEYENSEIATATLCWIDADPKTEGVSNGVAQVRAYAVMIQSNAGTIRVSGVDDGSDISVFSASGHMECSAKAHGNQVSLVTNLKKGEVAIVKIGDKSVKVVME